MFGEQKEAQSSCSRNNEVAKLKVDEVAMGQIRRAL